MKSAKMTVTEKVTFADVKESVSPYGEMMKLLKEYIDQIDTITYCDALPDEGEEDHLYIVRTGEAYIWDGEWIQLTGGGGTIEKIEVNGEEQPIVDKTVNLAIDRASVDGEVLLVGDSAGGGGGLSGVKVLTGEAQGSNRVTLTGKRGLVMCTTLDDEGCGLMLMGNGKAVSLGDGFYNSTASGDDYTIWNGDGDGIGYIAIITED